MGPIIKINHFYFEFKGDPVPDLIRWDLLKEVRLHLETWSTKDSVAGLEDANHMSSTAVSNALC